MKSESTYLATEELAEKIKYDARTIRSCLKDAVLIEGVHYIMPFGGRKILYLWEQIQEDMCKFSMESIMIPMSQGDTVNGAC